MQDLAQAAATAVEVVSKALGIVAAALGLGHMLVAVAQRAVARQDIPGLRPQIVLGRWLLLSMELTLAADIVATILTPTWEELGKLAAITILRTALNFFLAKEVAQAATSSAKGGD
jgi:uncharacterized membrane protein